MTILKTVNRRYDEIEEECRRRLAELADLTKSAVEAELLAVKGDLGLSGLRVVFGSAYGELSVTLTVREDEEGEEVAWYAVSTRLLRRTGGKERLSELHTELLTVSRNYEWYNVEISV